MWVPGGYVAAVLGMQLWVEVVSRTGDAGFAGMWPMLATAPLSLLALMAVPGPGDPVAAPHGLAHTGPPVPVEPLPAEAAPLPAAVSADSSLAEGFEALAGIGFYGALLFGALANATCLWALTRVVVRRRQAR